MSIRKVAVFAFIALAFAGGFLVIIVTKGTNIHAPALKPVAAMTPFEGKLVVQSIDDLRVGGRKIVLCGVAFAMPQSMRAVVTEAARREYQGLALRCKPVGSGTPCDGNVTSTFRGAIVAQCLTPDGMDLAAKLVEIGMLCGQPAQAGLTYKSCALGS
ncbi:hypothetical protein NKI39_23510 [Mesorhizobium sp. M0664]|uniref:hypothetical protein n=1 Tax=Mesorhizobium sp. M0664 TaxID=2956982 RepID=UPI00333659F6